MRVAIKRFLRIAYPITLLFTFGSVVNVRASTVLQMSFGEVVNRSELVFEGRVTGLESRRIVDGSIHTFVTFQITEIVKGQFPSDSIELRFLGGHIGSQGLSVSDLKMPEMDEIGIYFVETLRDFQINPLVGWAQGHYLIDDLGNGETVVTTANHDPIVSLYITEGASNPASQGVLSKGVAKGVNVRSGFVNKANQGLSAEQFKASIRELVELPK